MSANLLAEVRGFQALPKEELQAVAAIGELRSYANGDVVFSRGEAADALFVVEGGEVEIVLDADKPRPKSLAFRGRGELLGEMGVVDGSPRGATAIARGAVRLLRLPRPPFLALLERNPRLKTALRSLMAERHAETVRKVLG